MPDLILKAYHTPALCLSPVRSDRARIKDPAFVEIWMHRKSEGIASAVLVGVTSPGQSLTFDYNPTQKDDLVFYAVPKDAVGKENVSRLADAIKKTFSFAGSITAEDSSFDVTTEKNFYPVDCSSGNLTADLPSAVTCIDWEVTFKKMDSSVNTLTIASVDGEYIDNAIGMRLENQYDSIKLRSNGKDWAVVLDYGNPAVRVELAVNYALSANGSTASESSNPGAGYAASSCNNGLRHTNNAWGSGGGWSSNGSPSVGSPQWVEIDFGTTRSISEIDLFTLADAVNYNTDPALSDTFTLYGVVDFKIQSWNGSSWVDELTVTSNNKVWRQWTGLSISTSKIRCLVTAAINGSTNAHLVEIEAWG